MSVGELWEKLRDWYIANGTLTIEETSTGKEKFIWIDQARRGDTNVKGANQVLSRILQLFPKARRASLPNNRVGISGIGIISQFDSQISQPISQSISQLPLQNKGYESVKPVSLLDDEKKSVTPEISSNQLKQTEIITPLEEHIEELPKLANKPDTARDTGLSLPNELANEVANEPVAIATEPESASIVVGDTVRVKRDGDRIKAGEVGIAVKYTDFDKSFKVEVGDRVEGFYVEQLEVLAQ